ncbi:MAG TPA: PH domain-containing protein [Propionibacteriaceae bacterium]|nr:PH domain-containing protein [Propionibacteriaceae bacterium]
MPFSEKLLGEGEHVVLDLRTHWKALIWPAVAFVLLCLATGVVIGVALPEVPPGGKTVLGWVIAAVAVILLVWLCIVPFLRWYTTTYTITDRRLITRRGILNKSGHDLPLVRINNVEYQKSLIDRMLGCGTLTLTTAAEDPLTLHDIPDVENVHLRLGELMTDADATRREDT